MFLKFLILVFLLGPSASASVKLLLDKIGSQFTHVSETSRSIENITKTMSATMDKIIQLEDLNETHHVVETQPKQAKTSSHNFSDTDWQQFIDVRMARSDEDEQKSKPAEKEHVANPMHILKEDGGNVIPSLKVDDEKQSQQVQLTPTLLINVKSHHFVPNLNTRHIFDGSPFNLNVAGSSPIEEVGSLDIEVPKNPNSAHRLPSSVEETLSQPNTQKTVKYSRKHGSSSGIFDHRSSTMHTSTIPQALGNQGNKLDTSLGAPGVHLRINGYPMFQQIVDTSAGGYFSQSMPVGELISQQTAKENVQDASVSGLLKGHSYTEHKSTLAQDSMVQHLLASHHGDSTLSQHLDTTLEPEGIDRHNQCSYGHPVVEPTSHGYAQRYSNIVSSNSQRPHPSGAKIVNDMGYQSGPVILRQQFRPINALWDRLLLLRSYHIPLVVYDLPVHQGLGSTELQELLHNRGSYPKSAVSSTEPPSTISDSTKETGDEEEVSTTVKSASSNIRGDVDEFRNNHGDVQNKHFIVMPRGGAVEPDEIIFREEE